MPDWIHIHLRLVLVVLALAAAGGLRVLAAAIRGLDPETLALPDRFAWPARRRAAAEGEEIGAAASIVEVVERFVRAAHDLEAGALLAVAAAAWLGAPALAGPAGYAAVLAGGFAAAPLILVVLPEHLAAGREAALLGRAAPAVLLLAAVLHPLAVVKDLAARPLALLAGEGAERRRPAPALPPPAPADPTASALRQVLGFVRATVDEVMTPRGEIVAIESGGTIASLMQVVRTTRRGSYPIYRSTLDDLVGQVALADLLEVRDDAAPVDRYAREVAVVPESKRVFDLAMEMRADARSMVIVVDEFGTVSGLLNLHDLIGELVGEIAEDEERDEFEHRRLDAHTWVFNPSVKIERVNELTGLGIPDGDYQTLAGFILAQMGRVPLPKERLRWREGEFEILAADARRIRSVRLRRRSLLARRGQS